MTDIFFSYSSKDRDRVAAAHNALTERGFDVFWDLQVPGGVDWDPWIKKQLDQSRCAIVFWTANSAASVNVQHEVAIAREQGKLLQVMLEPLAARDLPMGALADQAVKLMKWCGDATDPEWAKLIVAVEDRATPRWLRQKVRRLEIALKDERQRVSEADAEARTLEDVHEREVAAQGDLRRERDRLQISLQAECQQAAELAAKLRKSEEARVREAAVQDDLRREHGRLQYALETQREALVKADAKVRALEEAYSQLHAADDSLRQECENLRKQLAKQVQASGTIGGKEHTPEVSPSRGVALSLPSFNICRENVGLWLMAALLASLCAYLPKLIEVALIGWNIVDNSSVVVQAVSMISPFVLATILMILAKDGPGDDLDRLLMFVMSTIILVAPIIIAITIIYIVPFSGIFRVFYLSPIVIPVVMLVIFLR